MDTAIEVTGAERGFIMLADRDGHLELKLARHAGKVSMSGSRFDTSRKIPEQVFATGEPASSPISATAALRRRTAVPSRSASGTCCAFRCASSATSMRRIMAVTRAPSACCISTAARKAPFSRRPQGRGSRRLPRKRRSPSRTRDCTARRPREARLDEELRIASQIQQALLPQARKNVGFCEAMGASVACRAIGGDFFECIDLPDGSFGFALGDVSGKGPPAALLTAVLQGIFSAQAFSPAEPKEALRRVNLALLSRGVEARFATIFFGVISPDGRLVYCNAGHNPPILFHGDEVQRLETGGMIVGLFPQASYEQEDSAALPGDLLILFSDGVSEALSAAGEEFGDDRIRDAVIGARAESTDAALERLLASVKQFSLGAAQSDDVTAMVVESFGPM